MAQCDVNFSGSLYKDRNSESCETPCWLSELSSRGLPPYFKRHKRSVIDALDDIERDVVLCEPIRWNVLHRVIREMRINCETAPDCFKSLTELLTLFERRRCKDAGVIAEVFKAMRSLNEFSVTYIGQAVEINNLFDVPYVPERSGLRLVWNAARFANLGLLKLQLKFGLELMTLYSTLDLVCENSKILDLLRLVISEIDRMEGKRTKITALYSILKPQWNKRLILVMRVLEIVRTMRDFARYREYFVECYRLFFDCIPEPYVTSTEIKSSLEKYLPDASSISISKIAEEFKIQLPQLAEVPQPRSLKHLCRIRVRHSLFQNLNLPHGISTLWLPTTLKEYIMLHDDGDYSIITRSYCNFRVWENNIQTRMSLSAINIPKGDDFITLFIKSLYV